MAALLTVAVVCLEISFLRDDFSVELVADHSSTTTPTGYKMTAMWSSQAGSLLLWAWVLSLATSGVLLVTRNRLRELVPWATAVLGGLAVFFTGLMLFGILSPAADSFPFTRLDPAPAEGVGLTPLLRHPAMAIHPPMLYSGYVLFSIPFAFAIARAHHPPPGRRLDPLHPPLRARRLALPRHGHPAGLVLVLQRAGLGRLLGLGPGRERLADAVAHRHRVPALGDGPGEAGDAAHLERRR